MDRPAGKPLRRARGAPGDRVGSRVRVRMRCERTTRRERGAAATTADELRRAPGPACYRRLRRDLPGDAPGPSTFGCRHAGPCPSSPRSLAFSLAFLSGLSLSLSRLLRFAPAARCSDSSRSRSLSPSRVRPGGAGAGFPSARSLASPGFFSLLARETAVRPPPSGGTGREGHTEATGSIERTDARESRRRRRRRASPLCPAGQPSSRAPAHHRLRSRVRTLSYRRKGKASEKKAPEPLAPTTGKGADSSRRLPRRNWRQKIRATPLAAPELQRPHHATAANTRRKGVDLDASG